MSEGVDRAVTGTLDGPVGDDKGLDEGCGVPAGAVGDGDAMAWYGIRYVPLARTAHVYVYTSTPSTIDTPVDKSSAPGA
jgi:hypothetical protein